MQEVDFQFCYGLTGTAELGMSEVHIYLIRFCDHVAIQRMRLLIPRFILFPLFAFPFAGAVDKIVLPVGMQSVNFSQTSVTGTAEG